MTIEDIIRYTARNLDLLSSDNNTMIDGKITREGLKDEANRIYKNIIGQHIMNKLIDESEVEARRPLYRTTLTVAAFDTVTEVLTSTEGVFGNADVDSYLYNPNNESWVKIKSYISGTQIKGEFASDWVGDSVYLVSPFIILDGDMSNFKEIAKVQIRYTSNDIWNEAEYTTVSNFKNTTDNFYIQTTTNPFYCITRIEQNGVRKRVLKIAPRPTNINGEIKVTYTKPFADLDYTDTLDYQSAGISEVIINALTSWAFRVMGDYDKAQVFEETNPSLGGVVPRGLTFFTQRLRPQRDRVIRFRNIWRRR